jgi:Flp pilus assembly protein TadB
MDNNEGMGCVIALAAAAAIFLVVAIAVWQLSPALKDAEAQRLHAEAEQERAHATIIEAQGQSRLDSAQALAVTSTAALPWGILGGTVLIIVLLTAAVVALTLVLRHSGQGAPRLIERQIIFVLPAGQSRREMFQAIGQGPSFLSLISHGEDNKGDEVIDL